MFRKMIIQNFSDEFGYKTNKKEKVSFLHNYSHLSAKFHEFNRLCPMTSKITLSVSKDEANIQHSTAVVNSNKKSTRRSLAYFLCYSSIPLVFAHRCIISTYCLESNSSGITSIYSISKVL